VQAMTLSDGDGTNLIQKHLAWWANGIVLISPGRQKQSLGLAAIIRR